MKKLTFIISAFLLSPIAVFAQNSLIGDPVFATLASFKQLINVLLPIVVALALLYFFWGLAKFILNAGDEDEQKKAKGIMIWGILAFFIMSAVWGIVGFVSSATGLNLGGTIDLPEAPSRNW